MLKNFQISKRDLQYMVKEGRTMSEPRMGAKGAQGASKVIKKGAPRGVRHPGNHRQMGKKIGGRRARTRRERKSLL